MPDPYPPHEIDYSEGPSDRNIDSPNSHTTKYGISNSDEEQHRKRERNGHNREPRARHAFRKNDGADLFGDRAEGVARSDNRRLDQWCILTHDRFPFISGFGF